MDWLILIGTTLLASLVTGIVAREIARRIASARGEPGTGVIILAILISLVVLQGAAKLAVLVEWLFLRQGIDPETALEGQFYITIFAASFLPIAAYVVTFLLVYRKMKAAA